MNFERGQDPKAAIGIGGINLDKRYDETVGEWKRYFSQFVGKTIKFQVKKHNYCNWSDRVEKGELSEMKTMKVVEAADDYPGNPGDLYFQEKGSSQCWYVDMKHPIYISS